MIRPTATPVVTERFTIGESPVWDEASGELLWCSITDGDIHALDPGTGRRRRWHLGAPVGSFGLAGGGRLVVALRGEIVLFDPATGRRETVATVRHAHPLMRLNDGKVGPDGAFYVGSMDERPAKEPVGRLYRIGPDGGVAVRREGIVVSNGLAWSPDGRTMYHSDSRARWVERWRFDPATGAMADCARWLDLDEATGRPDGAACDVEGCYWSAGVSAGRLNRFAASGDLLESVPVPSLRPTMPCFGGPDGRTLYVTSLTENVPDDALAAHPLCGGIVALEAAVAGVPVGRFGA